MRTSFRPPISTTKKPPPTISFPGCEGAQSRALLELTTSNLHVERVVPSPCILARGLSGSTAACRIHNSRSH